MNKIKHLIQLLLFVPILLVMIPIIFGLAAIESLLEERSK